MDPRMEEIYGNPDIGMEWIGEAICVEPEIEVEEDDSEKDLVCLFKGCTPINSLLAKMQEDAEAMTAEEREVYFDDLDQAIVRLCD